MAIKKKQAPATAEKSSKSQIAEKVRIANERITLNRALEKVKAGKSLSAREEKAVELAEKEQDATMDEMSGMPEVIKTAPKWFQSISETAKHIGCDRRTLGRWKKEGCSAFRDDGRINALELGRWAIQNSKDFADEVDDILEEKRGLVRAQRMLAELRFSRESDAVVLKSAIKEECESIMAKFDSLIEKEFGDHPLIYSDRSLPEIESLAQPRKKKFKNDFKNMLKTI